jgi:archaellum component FlaC
MFKLKAAVSGILAALVCAGFLSLVGCGSSEQQADRAAREAIAKADQDRAEARGLDDLDRIQKSFDALADNRDLSTQMQILVRARQSQLRLERVMMMMAELRSQELLISRYINDIESLAMQVAGAQASVDTLKSYDPFSQVEKLKATQAQIAGSADQLTWIMPSPTASNRNGSVTSPTLFAVRQEIDTLHAEIQQNQADTDAAHKLGAAKGEEAERYLRKAEGETGDQQVSDTAAAANARRDASIADSQAATLAVKLARLKADLDGATEQRTDLEGALKTLDDQINAQQTRWQTISQQIEAQKQAVQELIVGGAGAGNVTIDTLAQDLAKAMLNAAGLRDTINHQLNSVIPHLNNVIVQCNQLRGQWMADIREKQDDPDAIIWQQAQETLHPMYFNLEMASALEARASVAAAKTRIDLEIDRMFDGFPVSPAEAARYFKNLDIAATNKPIVVPGITALLAKEKTGVEMPKSFQDLARPDPDQLKQSEDDVNKAFEEALDAYSDQRYGATDRGPAADQRRILALRGAVDANRQWAQFATLIGDSSGAHDHQRAADDAQSQIDASTSLAAGVTPRTPAGAP